ncbi:MAG: hypothetical protein HY653_04585, partial [Acidobacteria bacterium]|nr:hypothetical protein [Acidobacteriota bacterium]
MRPADATGDSTERGHVSPLEERFERTRRRWGLIIGPLLAFVVYFWWAADYEP